MNVTVIATPGDRRPVLFADACRSCGLPEPRIVPWTDVLRGGDVPLAPGDLLRIDSPGEDAEADALLRGPGDPTRVGGGARWYRTFTAALGRVGAAASAAGARIVGDIDDIAVMFDKRLSHARMLAAGVPVPPALPSVLDYVSLRDAMAEAGERRVFVKPAHGSSASGVVALQTASGGRIRAVTSAATAPDGLHNSLRVRTYSTEPEVASLIDALAPDGLHVERWVPKASVDGRTFDLRVVVIGGEPTHAVVRTSRHPMTNLHLGGARGDLEAVRRALGPDGWEHAMDVCARAAACFPGSLMVGVDLLVLSGMRRFAVCEVNAFGDLLPRLAGFAGGPAEGIDTYTAQINAVQAETGPPTQAAPDKQDARAEEPDARADEPDARAEEPDARAEEPDARAEKQDARPDEPDARAEEPDARAEKQDARPDEPDARDARAGRRGVHADERDVREGSGSRA